MEPNTAERRRTGVRSVCILLVAAILAGSCAAEDAEPSTTPDALRGDLQTARQRWEQADIATYRYTFENDCGECDPSARAPHEVVVWAGAHFDPGDVAPSVEEIFVEIEEALDTDRSVAVTFDPDLGYPTDVGFDSESRPVDGGRHWVVHDLKPGLPGSPVSTDVVARAEQTWLASRPDAYEYTLTVFCDCPLAGSAQTRVEGTTVVGHQVLYDETTGGTVTPMSIDAMFSDLAELMASIDGVVEGGVRFEGSARFDPELGYPIWVGLDVTVLEPDADLAAFPSQLVVTITDLHAVDIAPAPEAVDQLAELDEARARWSDFEQSAYRYELALHMMMSAEFAGPFAVTVVDGAVTEITRDGEPVPEAQVTAYTIDDLFRLVETALSDGVDSSVTYDERWGHPMFVALDLDAIAVDGGLVLSVSNLAPIDE
jgi:hypothetical protein